MPLGVWENSSQHGRNEWKRKKKGKERGGEEEATMTNEQQHRCAKSSQGTIQTSSPSDNIG